MKLDGYFLQFEKNLLKNIQIDKFNHNRVKIDLMIENSGNIPAKNIDIELHFPDGFELFNIGELPKVQKEPKPPFRPKNRFDFDDQSHILFGPRPPLFHGNFPSTGNSSWTIKKTNSYDVEFHLPFLKHNQHSQLESLFANFEDLSVAKGFQIDYTLFVANLPKPVQGILHVNFK